MKHQDAKLQKGVLKRTKLSGDTNIPTCVSIGTKSHTKVSLIFVEYLVKEDVTLSVRIKWWMIPRILAATLAKARMGMPFPIVVEIILMEKELLLTVINPAAFFTEGLIMGIVFPLCSSTRSNLSILLGMFIVGILLLFTMIGLLAFFGGTRGGNIILPLLHLSKEIRYSMFISHLQVLMVPFLVLAIAIKSWPFFYMRLPLGVRIISA